MTDLNYIQKAVHNIVILKTETALQSRLPMIIQATHICSSPVLNWDQVNFLSSWQGKRDVAWVLAIAAGQIQPAQHPVLL